MNYEVVQAQDQREWDRRKELDWRCRPLTGIDVELVEWTLPPARAEGKCVSAALLLTDHHRPLEQLAALLRRVADEVERLNRPRGSAAQLGVLPNSSQSSGKAA